MNNTTISIIVPVYNTEKQLPKCIKSLVDQTYRNIEIILVNDGSADNSLCICREFSASDDRIIVIDQGNEGVSSARNKGLDAATGAYIGFVDSDDYVSVQMYEKLLEAMRGQDADIAECGYYRVNTDDIITHTYELTNTVTEGSHQCSHDYLAEINTTHFVCNKLFRRSLLKDIRFPQYRCSEDFVVNTKTSYICGRKVTIKQCMYYYVTNIESATHQSFTLSRLDTVRAGKEIFRFHEERYNDLCPYIALYICNYLLDCYIGLKKNSDMQKKTYITDIIKDFHLYHPKISEEAFKTVASSKKHVHFVIFAGSPLLYGWIVKLFAAVRKIKNKITNRNG